MISIYYRKLLLILVVSISAILLLITYTSIYFLYKTAEKEQLKEYENSAGSLAALMEAVAEFDAVNSV
ncbi:MAG: hypothetical protein OEZ34_13995, partial [Spirochaetia bacterium]|nr:hypothetical protein [Spirochaetia bacterium]